MAIDEIYTNGEHYDRLFGPGPIEFWKSRASLYGDPVLELGCGTGKLSIPLAESGCEVTGIDLSRELLEFAKQKSEAVRWVFADMRKFELDKKFALVMLPSNNLCHLHTIRDFQDCCRCVRRHMLPEGRFVIDVFVPDLKLLLQGSDHEYTLSEYDDPDGRGRVVVKACSTYENDTQISRTETIRRIAGVSDVRGSLDLRMYFPRELEALLLYNGFEVENRFGGHNGEAFCSESGFQVIVCRLGGPCHARGA